MSCCVGGPCPGGPQWTQVRTLASAASLLSTASVSTKKSLLWSHRFPGSVGICSGGIHVQRCSPARGPAKSPSTCFPVTLQPAVCGSCFSIFSPAFGRGRHFAFCRDGVSFLIAILTSISLIASEQGYLFICKHGYAIFPFSPSTAPFPTIQSFSYWWALTVIYSLYEPIIVCCCLLPSMSSACLLFMMVGGLQVFSLLCSQNYGFSLFICAF